LVALAGLCSVNVYAQSMPNTPFGVTTLHSSTGDEFGFSISSSGGYVVVGSPQETVGGNGNAGRVYVYSQASGALLYSLISPNSQANGYFGTSVSTGYGIVVVGAPEETSGGDFEAGNAYVFSVFTGDLISSLTSDFPSAEAGFGLSVAAGPVYKIGVADGNLVAVGAPGESDTCSDGRVSTFIAEGANGIVDNNYCSPNPSTGGDYGFSVAIGGGYMAIGAYGENAGYGYVYTYHAKSGLSITTLQSPNQTSAGEFGYSLALSTSGVLAVGAPGENNYVGNAYTFSAATGSLIAEFTTPAPQDQNGFGNSVALGKSSGTDILVVGAPFEEVGHCPQLVCVDGAGHAYSFNALTGSSMTTYTSPNPQTGGNFGYSVAIYGKATVIGAPFESSAGNAYIF